MRCHLVILILLVVLPRMSVWAAPIPEPSAILDIGPPPKGKTVQEHRRAEIDHLTCSRSLMALLWHDAEVQKLSLDHRVKGDWDWLAKNVRFTEEEGDRCLRLSFRAGSRAEQVVLLNTLLRVYVRLNKNRQERYESACLKMEVGKARLGKLIKEEQNTDNLKRWQKELGNVETRETNLRAEIARLNQITVIKWAK